MKVARVMSKSVGTVEPGDTLSKAIHVMWEKDCGAVPVVFGGEPVGMLTDRDIAVAVATSNRRPAEILVSEVTNGSVITCEKGESVTRALKRMGKSEIRRMPVTNKKGKLVGIFSIADALNSANGNKSVKKAAVKTLSRIIRPRPIVLVEEKSD